MQLFYCPGLKFSDDFLDREESHHCANVLRKKEGDIIDITDGYGNFYKAQIRNLNPKKCLFSVLSSVEVEKEHYSIHIAIAPTKNADRMEWFIEKAVEIGVNKISFLHTTFNNVPLISNFSEYSYYYSHYHSHCIWRLGKRSQFVKIT